MSADVEIQEVDTGGKLSFEFEARSGGHRVGRIQASKLRSGGYHVELIYVSVQHRHQGIGTALYEAAAEEACRRRSRLVSDVRNPGAFSNDFWHKQLEKGRAEIIGGPKSMPRYALRKDECPIPMLKNGSVIPDGYTLDPSGWVEGTVFIEDELDADDAGFFHVTTRITAVTESGRMKSRRDLQQEKDVQHIALGGGVGDDRPDLISFTFDYWRAQWLRDAMVVMAEVARGDRSASEGAAEVVQWASFPNGEWYRDDWDVSGDDDMFDFAAFVGIYTDDIHPDAEVDLWTESGWLAAIQKHANDIDATYATPERAYDLVAGMEAWIRSTFMDEYAEVAVCFPQVGFTAPWEEYRKIDPKEITIVQCAVKEDAEADIVLDECELRFHPEDVLIVAVQGRPEFPIPVPEREL